MKYLALIVTCHEFWVWYAMFLGIREWLYLLEMLGLKFQSALYVVYVYEYVYKHFLSATFKKKMFIWSHSSKYSCKIYRIRRYSEHLESWLKFTDLQSCAWMLEMNFSSIDEFCIRNTHFHAYMNEVVSWILPKVL